MPAAPDLAPRGRIAAPATPRFGALQRFPRRRNAFLLMVVGLFLLKGAAVPGPGFGDLWFNTDVARGVGDGHLNVYDGVDEQLESRYRNLSPAFVAPYGPTYYYPLWVLHRVTAALGPEDPLRCDAGCELARRPLWWGFLAKVPHLVVDAAAAVMLVLLLPRRHGRRAALAWMSSPGLFYVFYVMGQNDAFPLSMLVLGFGLLVRRLQEDARAVWWVERADVLAMIALGIGGSMKMLPLFFAPGFAFVVAERARRAVGLTAVAVLTMLLTALPFLGADYFVRSFLLSQRIVVLLTNDLVGLSPLVLTVLTTIVIVRRSSLVGTVNGLLVVLVATSAAISLFTEFNPQRGVYLAGAVAIVVGFRRLPILVVLAASAPVLIHPLTSPALGPGVLAHLLPVYGQVPAPVGAFGRSEYLVVFRLLARTFGVLAVVVALVELTRRRPLRARVSSPWLQPAFGGAVSLVLLLVLTGSFVLDRRGPEPAPGGTSTGDLAGHVLRQAFPVESSGGAVRVDVLLDPFNRVPPRTLTARLLSDCGPTADVLASVSANGLVLFDGSAQYVAFDFDREVGRRVGAPCFELDLRAVPAGRGVGATLTSKSGLGPATVDGESVAGALAMRDRYRVDAGQVVAAWRDLLSDELGVLLLSLAFAGVLGAGVAVLAWSRPFGSPAPSRPQRSSS